MSANPVVFGYPVVLDLHGVPVLVVGAGPVAVRKIVGPSRPAPTSASSPGGIDAQLEEHPLRDGVGEVRRRAAQRDR